MAGRTAPKRERSAAYAELTPEEVRIALERREAQKIEYGTWVADRDITVPFQPQLAYRKGDPVPVSNVERWDYDMEDNYMGAVCVVPQDSDEGRALINPNNTATIALGLDGIGAQAPTAGMEADATAAVEAEQKEAARAAKSTTTSKG